MTSRAVGWPDLAQAVGRALWDVRAAPPTEPIFWCQPCGEPRIVYTQAHRRQMKGIQRLLRGRPALILRGPIGCEDGPKYGPRWARYHRWSRWLYPEHELVFLCNTREAHEELARRGVPSHFCSQYGMVDESLFRVNTSIQKEFDAVYNAQMEPVKRHELATAVQRLALITYRIEVDPSYFGRTRNQLSHAQWLNFDPAGDYHWLSPEEVGRGLARSKVGLILSAAEGANYATVEYLLSGLPVVTTRSRGGRSVLYDDRYVKVVEDDPAAVAAGVPELIARKLDPEVVRSGTIARICEHRKVFLGILQSYVDSRGGGLDLRATWNRWVLQQARALATDRRIAESCGRLGETSGRVTARRRDRRRFMPNGTKPRRAARVHRPMNC